LQFSGTNHSGTTCDTHSTYWSISGNTVSYTSSADAGTFNLCPVAMQSGTSNSPYVQEFAVTGSAVASTFDPARNTGDVTLNNGYLTAYLNTNHVQSPEFGTLLHSSGKWVFRVTWDRCSGATDCGVGVATSGATSGDYLGIDANAIGIYGDGNYWINGQVANAPPTGNIGTTFGSGDQVDVLVDLAAKTIQIAVNGGAPSLAVSIAGLTSMDVSPAINFWTAGDQATYTGQPNVSYAGTTDWDD
jgi:hypothetical protein